MRIDAPRTRRRGRRGGPLTAVVVQVNGAQQSRGLSPRGQWLRAAASRAVWCQPGGGEGSAWLRRRRRLRLWRRQESVSSPRRHSSAPAPQQRATRPDPPTPPSSPAPRSRRRRRRRRAAPLSPRARPIAVASPPPPRARGARASTRGARRTSPWTSARRTPLPRHWRTEWLDMQPSGTRWFCLQRSTMWCRCVLLLCICIKQHRVAGKPGWCGRARAHRVRIEQLLSSSYAAPPGTQHLPPPLAWRAPLPEATSAAAPTHPTMQWITLSCKTSWAAAAR
jgi:hypothetical protein